MLLGTAACVSAALFRRVQGPITSFFFGKEQYLVLDAGADFNAGDELTMSYGGRDAHQLLQYQGFCGPLGESDYAQVEAALDGLESDKFYKIRYVPRRTQQQQRHPHATVCVCVCMRVCVCVCE